jgi:hypothetical protein
MIIFQSKALGESHEYLIDLKARLEVNEMLAKDSGGNIPCRRVGSAPWTDFKAVHHTTEQVHILSRDLHTAMRSKP